MWFGGFPHAVAQIGGPVLPFKASVLPVRSQPGILGRTLRAAWEPQTEADLGCDSGVELS